MVIGGIVNSNVPGRHRRDGGTNHGAVEFPERRLHPEHCRAVSVQAFQSGRAFHADNEPFHRHQLSRTRRSSPATWSATAPARRCPMPWSCCFPPRVRETAGQPAIRWRARWRTIRAATPFQRRRGLMCRWLSRAIMSPITRRSPVLTLGSGADPHHESDADERHGQHLRQGGGCQQFQHRIARRFFAGASPPTA